MGRKRRHRCPLCPATCTTSSLLTFHFWTYHLENDDARGNGLICICEEVGFTRDDWGLSQFGQHIDAQGGLLAHVLAVGLGVPNAAED